MKCTLGENVRGVLSRCSGRSPVGSVCKWVFYNKLLLKRGKVGVPLYVVFCRTLVHSYQNKGRVRAPLKMKPKLRHRVHVADGA